MIQNKYKVKMFVLCLFRCGYAYRCTDIMETQLYNETIFFLKQFALNFTKV